MRNISFCRKQELLSRSMRKEIIQEGRKGITEVRITTRVGAVATDKDIQAGQEELCGDINKGRRYKKIS